MAKVDMLKLACLTLQSARFCTDIYPKFTAKYRVEHRAISLPASLSSIQGSDLLGPWVCILHQSEPRNQGPQ